MKYALVILAFAFSGLWLAYTPSASAADSCAALREKRQTAFRNHAAALQHVREIRSELAAMNTVDPTVIDAQLALWKKRIQVLKNARQIATSDEETQYSKTWKAAQEGYDFWQAKKAHEVTGGMVDVPAATQWKAYLQEQINKSDLDERNLSGQIDQIDREMSKCKNSKATGSAGKQRSMAALNWAGRWQNGATTETISGGGNAISYSGLSQYWRENGTCTVSGNVATCRVSLHFTSDDDHFTADETAHSTLKLSGNSIVEHKVIDSVSCSDGKCGPNRFDQPGDFTDRVWQRE